MRVSSFQIDDSQPPHASHSKHSEYQDVKFQLDDIHNSLTNYQRKFQSPYESTKPTTSRREQTSSKRFPSTNQKQYQKDKGDEDLFSTEKLPLPEFKIWQDDVANEQLQTEFRETFHPKTLAQELHLRKLKFFDAFTPGDQKILSSPYQLLKHSIMTRDRTILKNLLEDFNNII